ncbi:glycosyltransferase [Pseudomonas sp. RC10]|uniref:glycosyltransferase n=1 Tax=Pseudomonas bambusae TaxID=3139142 RepID=UPI003138BC75
MPLKQPKIAILLAAHDGMAWIEEQLNSIQAQIDVDVCIYISVDPSTDGTEAWCANYADEHANVVLMPNAGRFGGAARNFFRLLRDVDVSAFDYVAFSDQDDIWHRDKLTRAVSVLSTGTYAGYSSNVTAFWEDGRRMLIDKAQPQVKWDYLFEAAGPGCTYVLTPALAVGLRAYISKEWDNVQAVALHDWFCYAFARSKGFSWFIDPLSGLDYRQHSSNQIGVNSGLASAMTRLKSVRNGWWFTQIRLIASLLDTTRPSIVRDSEEGGILSVLKFLFVISKCRRRTRDRLALLLICLFRGAPGR